MSTNPHPASAGHAAVPGAPVRQGGAPADSPWAPAGANLSAPREKGDGASAGLYGAPAQQSGPAVAYHAPDALRLFRECFRALADNVERVLMGKRDTVELALTALFAEGHLLIEDVPGTGKTTLARALAASLNASWQRVQFTPDLLPSDITGVSMFRQTTNTFEFLPGPVFANIVIGDEINRASPKTQSALLEVMEEARVTVDGSAHPVPRPFMVVATQNPVDMSGTYPLPEAQLDRFLMRLSVGYPDTRSEIQVASGAAGAASVETLPAIATAQHIGEFIEVARNRVQAAEPVVDYAVRIAQATRTSPHLKLGAGPRGSVALIRAAKVRAASQERGHLLPEDVKDLAEPVLTHRLMLAPDAELAGWTPESVLADILATVPAPVVGGLAGARR
ncbi:AAA family ATPase [Yinghuangia soli]|uniref:MoxR family ATPase n=1 Tax=Yinghuangia soli TaxID=2908204 RepID=A0AA41PVQ5_9ACTN|nr:MoxR family ATPase [Yinghuangia soli]MCF2526735.1 MoxR family ATPase [Yinghuangia soli]